MSAAQAPSTNLEKYESGNPILQRLIRRFHHRITEVIEPLQVKTVLDVGCGEGFLSRVLLDRFPGIEVSGIDASDAAVAMASTRCPEGSFRVAKLDDLERWSERYDLVVCSEVLEHVEEPARGIAALSGLAPHAVLTVPWEPWFQLANLARGKYLKDWGNHPEHIQRWTMGGFLKLTAPHFERLHAQTLFPWTLFLGKSRAPTR